MQWSARLIAESAAKELGDALSGSRQRRVKYDATAAQLVEHNLAKVEFGILPRLSQINQDETGCDFPINYWLITYCCFCDQRRWDRLKCLLLF